MANQNDVRENLRHTLRKWLSENIFGMEIEWNRFLLMATDEFIDRLRLAIKWSIKEYGYINGMEQVSIDDIRNAFLNGLKFRNEFFDYLAYLHNILEHNWQPDDTVPELTIWYPNFHLNQWPRISVSILSRSTQIESNSDHFPTRWLPLNIEMRRKLTYRIWPIIESSNSRLKFGFDQDYQKLWHDFRSMAENLKNKLKLVIGGCHSKSIIQGYQLQTVFGSLPEINLNETEFSHISTGFDLLSDRLFRTQISEKENQQQQKLEVKLYWISSDENDEIPAQSGDSIPSLPEARSQSGVIFPKNFPEWPPSILEPKYDARIGCEENICRESSGYRFLIRGSKIADIPLNLEPPTSWEIPLETEIEPKKFIPINYIKQIDLPKLCESIDLRTRLPSRCPLCQPSAQAPPQPPGGQPPSGPQPGPSWQGVRIPPPGGRPPSGPRPGPPPGPRPGPSRQGVRTPQPRPRTAARQQPMRTPGTGARNYAQQAAASTSRRMPDPTRQRGAPVWQRSGVIQQPRSRGPGQQARRRFNNRTPQQRTSRPPPSR